MLAAGSLALAPALARQPATPTSASAETASNAPRYSLNGIILGTTVRTELVTGPIPFDRNFSELTAQDKQAFKQLYGSLAADAEPPFPEDGYKPLSAFLIDISHRLSAPAKIEALINVDGAGNAKSIAVITSSDPGVTRAVGLAMLKQRFKPATCSGTPCEMAFPLRLEFAAAAGERGSEVDLSPIRQTDNNRSSPRVAGPRTR
ncbi:hypothetical protein BH09PSE6_BH09PSE6_29900 [soil metagenome]